MTALNIDSKLEGKMTCASKNVMRNFPSFYNSMFEIPKIGTFIGPFIESRKYTSLKFTGELCVMIMRNDEKFEEDLSCPL